MILTTSTTLTAWTLYLLLKRYDLFAIGGRTEMYTLCIAGGQYIQVWEVDSLAFVPSRNNFLELRKLVWTTKQCKGLPPLTEFLNKCDCIDSSLSLIKH